MSDRKALRSSKMKATKIQRRELKRKLKEEKRESKANQRAFANVAKKPKHILAKNKQYHTISKRRI